MKRPPCPTCKSTKWHKDASTGIVVCSEGHVMLNYRDETTEVDNVFHQGARARKKEDRKSKKGRSSSADPKYLHGTRAEYFSYQIQQLLLRMQVKALIKAWDLPAQEFEVICRDLWALYLATLSVPPQPEPLYAREEKGENIDITVDDRGRKGRSKPKSRSRSKSSPEPRTPHTGSESSLVDQLLTSDSDSGRSEDEDDLNSGDESWARWHIDSRPGSLREVGGPATRNVSILFLACWMFRIPVICSDFIKLIETYELPFLDFQRLLPPSVPDIWKTVVHMNDFVPPSPARIYNDAARLARRLQVGCEVSTPEFNAAPLLWRIVRLYQGPPVLYVMAKSLASTIELSLHIHSDLMEKRKTQWDNKKSAEKFKIDRFPVELRLLGIVILAMKLVYGFDGKERTPADYTDPATSLPRYEPLLQALREQLEDSRKGLKAIYSPQTHMTALDLNDAELDQYLDFCEKALLRPDGSSSIRNKDVNDFGSVSRFFPLNLHDSGDSSMTEDAPGPTYTRLEAIFPQEESSSEETLLPGDAITHFKWQDVLGTLPDDFELIVTIGAEWLGVNVEDVVGAVAACENGLAWWADRTKRTGTEQEFERFMANRARRHPDEEELEEATKSSKGKLHRPVKELQPVVRYEPLEAL